MKITGGTLLTRDLEFLTLEKRAAFGAFPDLNTARKEIMQLPGVPSGDLGDFGRGGVTVRRAMLTALLTAWDAGGTIPENTGILGWNGDGCTAENLAYWRDYADCGRTAGRGGLFVATLPTIPYCEVAIALGCRGGIAYLRTQKDTSQLWSLLAVSAPGTYICGEITRESCCMLFADNRQVGGIPPKCRTLADAFATLGGGR